MIDSVTRRPLRISTDGTAGPYIMVLFSQLDEVCRRLDENRIRYHVEEEIISLDGEPEIAVVDLGRVVDVAAIQTILDEVR